MNYVHPETGRETNRTWSFADRATGRFVGVTFAGPARDVAQNVRQGWIAVEGKHDHLSRRLDLETGQVVDYQPPQPDADHEWNAVLSRWVKREDVARREMQSRRVLARIQQLERQQLRPMRELAIDPTNLRAVERLRAIESEIAALRAGL